MFNYWSNNAHTVVSSKYPTCFKSQTVNMLWKIPTYQGEMERELET